MHRNSILSLGIIVLTITVLSFCSCGGTGIKDLAGLAGVWDYDAQGTVMVGIYSMRPMKGHFSGVYSILPMKIQDRQGYDWDWDYDGQMLQFELLNDIPIPDSGCEYLLIEGKAKFRMPMEYGQTVSDGVLLLENATITCHKDGKSGPMIGDFSIHMVKR